MQNRHKVVVVGGLSPQAMTLFEARDDIVTEVIPRADDAELLVRIGDASGVTMRTGRLTREMIEKAPRLQVVARHGVGYDNVDVEALTTRGIPLTVVGEANAVNVAEVTLYMMLELTKRGFAHDQAVRSDNWDARHTLGMGELWRKTLLIIGFGRVGRRVAARAAGFEMKILACDPYIDQRIIRDAGCTPVEDFRAVLPEADYVALHVPLTDETRHMIGAEELRRMKQTAILVNCARGGVVDEDALCRALQVGEIFGAGLDVLAKEPSEPNNPLFKLENTVFSPHMGGSSREATVRVSIVCAQNVLDAIDGKLNPDFVVNKEVLKRR